MTNSYIVAVQHTDKHANIDPEEYDAAKESFSTQFKQTHPSLFVPKHQYKKYKMKDGRNKTGLDVIKERPALMSEFAILNRIKLDVLRKSQEDGEFQEPEALG